MIAYLRIMANASLLIVSYKAPNPIVHIFTAQLSCLSNAHYSEILF